MENAGPPTPTPDFTIPTSVLRGMIRAYLVMTILLYLGLAINFLALPLSYKSYGGIFTNQWFWGIAFLGSGIGLSYGLMDRLMGRVLSIALLVATMVVGMWIFAVSAATVIGHINYVSPVYWIYVFFNNLLVILAHTFANPQGAMLSERMMGRLMRKWMPPWWRHEDEDV